MDAPSPEQPCSPDSSRALALSGMTRPTWDGRRPWGLVWCCADQPHIPELLLGAQPGELMVLQGAATLPSSSVTADIVWAAREHPVSHLFVIGHTGCRLLQHALHAQQSAPLVNERVARMGLFTGHDVDDVSRTVARHSASTLRRELARHGLALEIITAFADAHGRLLDVRVEGAALAMAQLS